MLVPGTGPGVGSLQVIGNSGWVADYGSPNPACGLVSSASNLRFALNCIGYLGGLTQQPQPASALQPGIPPLLLTKRRESL